jgi:hypothetical protein
MKGYNHNMAYRVGGLLIQNIIITKVGITPVIRVEFEAGALSFYCDLDKSEFDALFFRCAERVISGKIENLQKCLTPPPSVNRRIRVPPLLEDTGPDGQLVDNLLDDEEGQDL